MTGHNEDIKQTEWLREVASVHDLSIIRDVATGPMVAFSDLCLPYAARMYFKGMDFRRDFGNQSALAKHPKLQGPLRLNDKYTELNLNVDGWHANPDESTLAQKRFMRLAMPFFPEHPSKKKTLMALSYRFAQLASAFDRKRLTFTFRAIGASSEDYMHFDPNDYNAIAYLRGGTTHHLKHNRALLRAMRKWRHDEKHVNYSMPRWLMNNIFDTPPLSMGAWRGKKAGRPSLHGRVDIVSDLRLVGIAAVHDADAIPAYRTAPSDQQKRQDAKNSRYFG